jgi:hypothetical protein
MVLAAWFFEIGETGFKFCTAHKNACLKDFFQTGIFVFDLNKDATVS